MGVTSYYLKSRVFPASIKRVAEEYSDDYRKLKKEMNPLIFEGQKSGDSVAVGSAYYQLAIACFYQSYDDGVFTNAFKAVSLLRGLDEYELPANSLNALGFAYSEQENEQFALMLYDEALSFVKKHRIKGSAKSLILNNMCSCYHNMGDCKTAIRILNECIKHTDYTMREKK